MAGMIIVRLAKETPLILPEVNIDNEEGIRLDCRELFVGEGKNQFIRVSWRFDPSSVNLMDWIGLFNEEETASTRFIDYKITSAPSGTLHWNITTVHLEKSGQNSFVFRYFDGLTGLERACSPPIYASTVPRIRLTEYFTFFASNRIVFLYLTCTGLPPSHRPLITHISTVPLPTVARAGTVTQSSASRPPAHRLPPSAVGAWKHLDLDFPSSSTLISVKVFEQGDSEHLLIEGSVQVEDFLAAARQDLSVAVRTPLLRRRIHANQKVSVLIHFRLLPEKVTPPPPPSSSSSFSSLNSMHSSIASSSSSSSSSGISSGSNQSNISLIRERLGPLPEGWESRMDWHGRIFYIDHVSKRTSWSRPEMSSTMIEEEEEQRRRRRGVDNSTSKIYHPSRRTVIHSDSPSASDPIAIRFLRRDDFIALLHANQSALRLYHNSRVIKHIVHRIRKDASVSLALFEQNEDFVRFVNSFADTTQRLPEEWQATGESPTVFIDHSTRQTTLLDPRLPIPSRGECRQRRTRSAPPRQNNALRDVNGNSLLAGRSEEIAEAVARRRPEMANRIRRKLRIIERWGEVGLARMANDIDIVTAISLLESDEMKNEIMPTKNGATPEQEEFDEKVEHFYTSLQRSGYGAGPAKLRLRFSRASLLHDAYDQILAADVTQLKRAKLTIAFDDEDGLDYGGPSRELFYLLSRELFNPYYGLFEYAAPDRYIVQISPMSTFVDNHQSWMELAGRVLGLALVHRCLIDTFFTRPFYKILLELPFNLDDLENVDPEFCRSLKWIRTNRITEDLGFTFSVTQEIAGEVSEKELLPNGRELSVTDLNKEQFIQLMIKWRVERGVQPQSRALLRGLHQIIDRDFLRVFSVEQLELVLSGSVEIDLNDWQTWTEYKGGYSTNHVVIRWFWDTVEEMSNADRLKLLQFVTGTASVPYEGFRSLRGSTGSKKFTIERWGDERCLPRAHTCFNRLDLPSYPSRKILREKLRLALYEGIAYAIE